MTTDDERYRRLTTDDPSHEKLRLLYTMLVARTNDDRISWAVIRDGFRYESKSASVEVSESGIRIRDEYGRIEAAVYVTDELLRAAGAQHDRIVSDVVSKILRDLEAIR